MKRILFYPFVIIALIADIFIIANLIISGNFILIIGGLVFSILTFVIGIPLLIREIMYWATRKPEPDGWEDDLTNQL